eukprot:Pgem_evm3s19713
MFVGRIGGREKPKYAATSIPISLFNTIVFVIVRHHYYYNKGTYFKISQRHKLLRPRPHVVSRRN